MNMTKEKKIKINYITFIKKQYMPSTSRFKKWIKIGSVKNIISQINIIFVGKQRMRSLNKKYLNKDKSTNVLTFPYNDDNHFSGDIVLCPEVINKEAKKFGFSSDLRWAHMIIHSMLHLQGYDHKTKRERMNMENMEVKLLAHMNYGDPYVRK